MENTTLQQAELPKFDTLTQEEKIERLRKELINLAYENNFLKNSISSIQSIVQHFESHYHTNNGEVVVPINRKNPYPGLGAVANFQNFKKVHNLD